MTLNEELTVEGLDPIVKRAFLGVPEKILLPAATQLYKWTSRPLFDEDGRITPWWFFVHTTRFPSGRMADGFRVAEERAARVGKSHREFARARAAISGQFGNSMTNLLIVRLNVAAWAFAGVASGQREFPDAETDVQHVYFIGGAYQVWVPNLTRRHLTTISVRG